MALIVEDGTSISSANAYCALATADAYHFDRHNDAWLGSNTDDRREAAIVRACAYLDAKYRGRYPGYRTKGRAQGMEWPRVVAYTQVPDNGRSNGLIGGGSGGYQYGGYGYGLGFDYIPSNQVPREIVNATCEAALRELIEPGSLAPDLERGGSVRRLKADSVEIEYGPGANPSTVFQMIELALASLLMPKQSYSGRVARG